MCYFLVHPTPSVLAIFGRAVFGKFGPLLGRSSRSRGLSWVRRVFVHRMDSISGPLVASRPLSDPILVPEFGPILACTDGAWCNFENSSVTKNRDARPQRANPIPLPTSYAIIIPSSAPTQRSLAGGAPNNVVLSRLPQNLASRYDRYVVYT